MKRILVRLTYFGCALLVLITHEGKTYQISPTTLQVRTIKTMYLPILHLPISRKIVQEQDYVLCPLWKDLRLLPKVDKTNAHWLTGIHCTSGTTARKGPAYALFDSKTVGTFAYWKQFAAVYPRQAKPLFRRVISALINSDVDKATFLLAENSWLPIPPERLSDKKV